MKKINFLVMLLFLATVSAKAQVTIGGVKIPETFSILELISSNDDDDRGGMRLPQLTIEQREFLSNEYGSLEEMQGVQIFNTETQCVETWNGSEWIQECLNDTPTIPLYAPFVQSSCGITPSDGNKIFTCIEDPNAEAYEWFVDGDSEGRTISNSITFTEAQTPASVTVKYLFSRAFLKPTMLDVAGKGTNSWKYGPDNSDTNVSIDDFKMSETPVTQAQFSAVMGINPSKYVCGITGNVYAPSSSRPVDQVSWYAAITYCNKLSIAEYKTPVYSVKVNGVEVDWKNLTYAEIPTGYNANWRAVTCDFSANGYRLPTESEWEYAARGGTLSQNYIYSGSNDRNDVAWCGVNNTPSVTKPVKTKGANELGLYDMSGNVWEWCWNCSCAETFPAPTPSGITASNVTAGSRVFRGGDYGSNETYTRLSQSNGFDLLAHNDNLGIRVVLNR
jgi:formylglycine-generating enzyme required for sulfatase activity